MLKSSEVIDADTTGDRRIASTVWADVKQRCSAATVFVGREGEKDFGHDVICSSAIEQTARFSRNRIALSLIGERKNIGDIEIQRSNPRAAAAHYQRALQLEPNDPDANEGCGIVLLASDSNQDARPYLSRAIQLDPANVAAHYHLSQASRKVGDIDAAKREMDEFLKLKTQRENLKCSFDDLPLEAARRSAPGQDGQVPPRTASQPTAAAKDK